MSNFSRRTTRTVRKNSKPVPELEGRDTLLTEHEEQREFVRWFRQTYTGVKIFAIPNGGYRGKTQAMKLKSEGVSKGVPDLFIPEFFLWVEMKRKKGSTTSTEQKEWLSYLNNVGYRAVVCKGCLEAQKAVTQHVDAISAFTAPRNKLN
jgi:hypothetical protein